MYFLILSAVLMSGCVGLPENTKMVLSADQAAKEFQPNDELANVYIVHPRRRINGSVLQGVQIDGSDVGELWLGNYFLFSLPPGRHTIAVATEGHPGSPYIEMEAGNNYYYSVYEDTEHPSPLGPKGKVEILDEEEGKQEILRAVRAKPTFDPSM
ncbi:MAG TPA: DUF2846 domain-containing protein [Dehalococcoidia bacterium]|nr:DUF2846 domain-containing protein [Dehalococcoidia bacterium]